jgi:hypothetical protein
MDRFKIEAFLNEFWWLNCSEGDYQPLVEADSVEKVAVSRINEDFLSRTPKYDGGTGNLVDIADSERILLCDRHGFLVGEVAQGGYCRHNEAHQDDECWEGETVGEALSRLKDSDEVFFAVLIHTGYEIRNHHSVGGYRVVVYKPPKGFSLKGWVDEKRRQAAQMLQSELAEIDAEA